MIPRFNKEPALREGHIHAEHRHRINDTTDVHFHDYFEIEYIIEGDGINYIDGKMCSLESGLLYFLSPINTHNLIQKKTNLLHLAFEESHCDTTLLHRSFPPEHKSSFIFLWMTAPMSVR